MPKLRLEIAVNEDFVETAVNAVIKSAKTGSIGDGKIFILPLEDCIRIRTGERGSDAIGGYSKHISEKKKRELGAK